MKNQTRLSCRSFGFMIVLLSMALGFPLYVLLILMALVTVTPLFFLVPSELIMRLGKLVAKIFLPLLLFSIYFVFVIYSLVLPRRFTRVSNSKSLKKINFEEM